MPTQNTGFRWTGAAWLFRAILAATLLSPGFVQAQERVVPNVPARPRVPIYDPGSPVLKKVLKNGVTLLVQEQRTSDRVAGAVALRMGTLYESDDEAGRGQVLIKAITAGTDRASPAELALRILAADATLQAGVGPDLGQITIGTKRERVDQAIDLLSEIVLQPSFPDTAVDASRQIALRAAADEQENPLKAAYSMFLATVYRGSPLARPVAGTVSGLADCSRKDILSLYHRYFVGGNMVVCFVGNLDGKKAMAHLEKVFATAARGTALQPVAGDPVPLAADTTLTGERDMVATCLVVGYPAAGYAQPDYPAFKVIESYLASEDRSPITLWLPQNGLAQGVGVVFPPYPKHGSIAVYLGSAPHNVGQARDSVTTIMKRLGQYPLEETEWQTHLKRVQNGMFDNQNDPMVRARSMSQYEVGGVGYDWPRRFELGLLKLNAESVRAAAQRYFTHACTVLLSPPKSESKL